METEQLDFGLGQGGLKYAFLAAQSSKRADIGDEQRRAKLIVVSKRPQCKAPIFKADSTATAIVARLHDFVLQSVLDRIIGERGGRVPALAIQLAPTTRDTDLILLRLQDGIGVQPELSQTQKGLPVGMYGTNQTDGGQAVWQEVVVGLQLNVISSAVIHFYVADDGGPTAGFIGEGKRRDVIERGKDVALAGNQSSAECRVEVVFGGETPGEELFGLAIGGFAEKALGEAGLEFAGIGDGIVFIEANDAAEIINAGYIVVDDQRFDDVLPLGLTAVPYPLEGRRTQFDAEFAVGADQTLINRYAVDELLAVIGEAESGGAGYSEPVSPAQWKGHVRRELGSLHHLVGIDQRIGTAHGAAHSVESKVHRPFVPEGPVYGTEADFRGAADDDAGFGLRIEKVLIIKRRDIQAESAKVIGDESIAVLLGNSRFVESCGESEAEGERA